ncbi:MAG TPA: prephenate dehydrogenase/arogenate dehydrogenase family protein [Acidimicrobiia bacterium]|nr:prephenate dehydrogenase/arogenate dehydrogenase family protein [Acidimicrobiia bacterium]
MSRVLILGTGLIGASIGAGLRDTGWTVVGWDPVPAALDEAERMGALNEITDDVPGTADTSDLVVLAGPVGAIIDTLNGLRTETLVTDVAGVKGPIVEAGRHLSHFVGGHPMAGRESSGPGAASSSMFRGASWVLTTDHATDADLAMMEEVVAALGAVPVRMTSAEHDTAVAAVSHVPQVLASALVNMVAEDGGALSLAAGGFRDVTRIALSEPAWWTEILTQNRGEISRLVRSLSSDLVKWADQIEAGDRQTVADGLESARQTRRRLTAPVAAVQVLLEDRPGEVARVGHALAESAVDVRDLQLRHATRGGGGVLTLSVLPGQEASLRSALEAEGFRLVG